MNDTGWTVVVTTGLWCAHSIHISRGGSDKPCSAIRPRIVAVLALAGCSSHHHHAMAGKGKGDAYWQKGQQDMASLIDRTVKDQGKAEQVKSVVSEVVAELKVSREQERAGHRRLYELNANYAAIPEEFPKVLDDAYNQRMQSATKVLALRFK